MTDISNDNIWIDVETLAKLKNITHRAVRLSLNQNRYEYKVENIRGGKTYKIKLSTLGEELQLKYFQEYYEDFKSTNNEVIELSNLNIKQEKLIPNYIGTSIENKPAHLKRNEKLHKNIHEKYAFTPTIEQARMMIDKWLEFKHSQPCPNYKKKTIQQVINEFEKQNIDENPLDDLMMAQEIKSIGRNGIRFLKADYFDEALY